MGNEDSSFMVGYMDLNTESRYRENSNQSQSSSSPESTDGIILMRTTAISSTNIVPIVKSSIGVLRNSLNGSRLRRKKTLSTDYRKILISYRKFVVY
ncbi:hypothetical protein TNIN_487471 [Trichonephila inaurata madagascariensis]|uniref:Uncharacterized protein n=1 Tax=Trichonephila inaurata madagascariensis TaxID=2747483 RepID=A0A8X6YK76_9ARAC|nr:hypothetical protein TNIN_487471 [Trichonephila inaurata madagascariensis]